MTDEQKKAARDSLHRILQNTPFASFSLKLASAIVEWVSSPEGRTFIRAIIASELRKAETVNVEIQMPHLFDEK